MIPTTFVLESFSIQLIDGSLQMNKVNYKIL